MNVHMIKGKTDNCYLVTDGKGAMLVDTASGEVYGHGKPTQQS